MLYIVSWKIYLQELQVIRILCFRLNPFTASTTTTEMEEWNIGTLSYRDFNDKQYGKLKLRTSYEGKFQEFTFWTYLSVYCYTVVTVTSATADCNIGLWRFSRVRRRTHRCVSISCPEEEVYMYIIIGQHLCYASQLRIRRCITCAKLPIMNEVSNHLFILFSCPATFISICLYTPIFVG